MSRLYPTQPNAPCFSTANFCVTQFTLRKHLKIILCNIGLGADIFTFHTFRRSGATLACNLDIGLDSIRRHGMWKSDAINSYMVEDPHRASGVDRSLQAFFNHM